MWFAHGLAPARLEDPSHERRYGYVAADGRSVTDSRYVFARSFFGGLAAVRDVREGVSLWGYVDTSGEIVIDFRFSQILRCHRTQVVTPAFSTR